MSSGSRTTSRVIHLRPDSTKAVAVEVPAPTELDRGLFINNRRTGASLVDPLRRPDRMSGDTQHRRTALGRSMATGQKSEERCETDQTTPDPEPITRV